MSRFYGTLQGQADEATRRGSAKSGLVTYAAGWAGAVRAEVYDHKGKDWCSVALVPWRGEGVTRALYVGPVGEYKPETGAPQDDPRQDERTARLLAAARSLLADIEAMQSPNGDGNETFGPFGDGCWDEVFIQWPNLAILTDQLREALAAFDSAKAAPAVSEVAAE